MKADKLEQAKGPPRRGRPGPGCEGNASYGCEVFKVIGEC
jgi:hypothetical protein